MNGLKRATSLLHTRLNNFGNNLIERNGNAEVSISSSSFSNQFESYFSFEFYYRFQFTQSNKDVLHDSCHQR